MGTRCKAAGPASRRYGYEINLTYQALKWLEFYASYSGDHARFMTDFGDCTGHVGRYLRNAAEFWYIDRLMGEPAEGVPDLHTSTHWSR